MSGTARGAGLGTAALVACLASTLSAVLLFRATDTTAATGPLLVACLLVLVPGGLHLVYSRLRPNRLIAAITGGLALLNWAGLAAGMAALAALRTRAPLVDDALGGADAFLGLSAPAFILWVARHPWFCLLLEIAYASTVPAVFVAVLLLGGLGRTGAMWRLCFIFAGAGLTCTLPSALFPAIGVFVHYDIPSEICALLPASAGRFYLPAFEAYHSGLQTVVDIRQLVGVVTFPSFHTAMAVMVAHAVQRIPLARVASRVWCGLVMVSTVPIGGHYFVDSLGGLVVWAGFAALSRAMTYRAPASLYERCRGDRHERAINRGAGVRPRP